MSALTAASLTTSFAGAYASSIAAKNKAAAQQATLAYEASVAKNNQTIANYQGGLAVQNGQIMAENQQLKTAQTTGDQRAAMAANGIDLGTGSATDVLATTKFMGERDALQIQDNAARQAWAYRTQAQGYGAEAAADTAIGDSISPSTAMATSLIGSASQVANSWYQYNKAAGSSTSSSTGGGPG